MDQNEEESLVLNNGFEDAEDEIKQLNFSLDLSLEDDKFKNS